MKTWPALEWFLSTDPLDEGCAAGFEVLDLYVERELAYGDAAMVYPGVAAHLLSCTPCLEVFEGLLAAIAR
jgi:hypothetical protein